MSSDGDLGKRHSKADRLTMDQDPWYWTYKKCKIISVRKCEDDWPILMRLTPDEYNHKPVLATIFTPNVYDGSVPEGRVILARQELIYTIGFWDYAPSYIIELNSENFSDFQLENSHFRVNCFSVKIEYLKIASYDFQENHIVCEFRDIWDSMKNLAAKTKKN